MYNKIIAILMTILFALPLEKAMADTFGDSCTIMPIVDETGYLYNDTAYGFVRENLDIKTHAQGKCEQEGEAINFCVRNKSGSTEVCKQVSLAVNSSAKLVDLTDNTDIIGSQFVKNIPLTAEQIENQICVTMPTSRGKMPLLCRNADVVSEEDTPLSLCRALGDGCYEGESKSQSLFSFSGVTIHCLRNSLDKMFYTVNECRESDDEITFTSLRPFPAFQNAMTNAVTAALILYVIFYGFKLVMNYEVATPNQIFLFILKFIFVLYFASGIWGGDAVDGVEVKRNGMTEFALPFLLDITAKFTEFIFVAAGSTGLCDFDPSKYEAGYSFYRVWDAIDCRMAFYLGMDLMHNVGVATMDSTSNLFSNPGEAAQIMALNTVGNFKIFTVMYGFMLSGGIVVVLILLVFVVIFVSVIMYFITVYLACLVTLYTLSYLAPIFVPMLLFQRTKDYFEAWVRIVVSCALQPAIIGGFLALLLTVFDGAMYGNCEFNRVDYDYNGSTYSTFQIALPVNEIEKCESSVGYKLLRYFSGEGWQTDWLVLFEVPKITDYFGILTSLIYLSLYLALFYYFIKSANSFASRLVGGPDLSSVTINPNMLVDKVISLAKAAAGYAVAAVRLAKGDAMGALGDAAEATGEALKDTSKNTERNEGQLVGSDADAHKKDDDGDGEKKEEGGGDKKKAPSNVGDKKASEVVKDAGN